MRMWMLPPEILCIAHLTGEHGELHKHRHVFANQYSIDGRVQPPADIEPLAMQTRHNELAKELLRRGGSHYSPYDLPDLSYLTNGQRTTTVNRSFNLFDLCYRCRDCAARVMQFVLLQPNAADLMILFDTTKSRVDEVRHQLFTLLTSTYYQRQESTP